jgi:hypothetical protein
MTIKLRFTFETDNDSEKYISEVKKITGELCEHININNYGVGVSLVAIHLRFLKVVVGFEGFFALKKPKFKKVFKHVVAGKGAVVVNGYFTYEVLIGRESYDELLLAKGKSFSIILGREIITSLDNLEKLPKKLSGFDCNKFKSDVQRFFE